ncbi:bifunctional phosphatase PAP2/diacylglycerol kinase family protein [soil metagenome]
MLAWGVAVPALVAAGRFGRRAVLRGSTSGLAVSGLSALVGAAFGRRHPAPAAAAVAFTVGASLELPRAGVPLAEGVAALLVPGLSSTRRTATSLLAAGGGAAVALGSRQLWPVAPHAAADLRPAGATRHHRPAPEGERLTVVVNPSAGSAFGEGPLERLAEALPDARLVELEEGDDLMAALSEAASEARAVGMVGGDGSLNAAAGIAHAQGLPLFAVPGGTLNHFARDVGLTSVDDALAALAAGEVVAVDLAEIDGRPFLNTASFGAYVELVDTRERLEGRLGKWPAMIVALVRVLRRSCPTEVEIDGRTRRLWMIFVGNCTYHPHGFAPSWRTRLDDGRLDVRLLDASMPAARLRLVAAVLTGRLGRCQAYEEHQVSEVRVRRLDDDRRLARDGETFDGSAEFVISKCPEPLLVYAPHR